MFWHDKLRVMVKMPMLLLLLVAVPCCLASSGSSALSPSSSLGSSSSRPLDRLDIRVEDNIEHDFCVTGIPNLQVTSRELNEVILI